MAIATLTIDMVAKLANLERDMGKATHIAERNAQRMEKAFAGVAKTLATLGASLSVGAFVGLVRGLADSGDALAKLSTRTGDTVEELSKLQYAASLADTSNETLEKSLTKLNRVMGDAANGVKEAKDALDRFGIEPGSKLTTIEAFQQIADRVKATGDQTKIASALNDVFGRSFAELIPLLKGGSDELKSAGDELERMGGVMSGELARASERFNDNLTKIGTSLNALKIQSLGGVIEGLEKMTGNMIAAASAAGGMFKGLALLATVSGSESDNPGKAIESISKKIQVLKKDRDALSKPTFANKINDAIFGDVGQIDKYISFLTAKQTLLKSIQQGQALAISGYGNEGRGLTKQGEGILGATNKKETKTSHGPKTKQDRYTDLLTPAAEAYAAVLKSIDSAQLAAEKSTLKLSNSQSALYDLISSPLWDQFPQAWKDVAIAQAEAGTAAEKAAEDYNHLKDLIDATPTAKLEETRNEMLFLADAFLSGKISADQFSEAAQTALGNLPKEAKEATDAMSEFAIQAARNMQDAFAEFLFDPFKGGVGDMLKNFGTAIQKMIAQAVSADLFGRLFGNLGGEGGGSGVLGTVAKFVGGTSAVTSVASGLPGDSLDNLFKLRNNFASYDVGTDYVPYDQLALIHRGEKIIPAAQNATGAGTPQTINITLNMSGSNNSGEMRRAGGQAAREVASAVQRVQRYG